jgi:two-component system sensor histidine kinase EvgS
VAGIDHFLAKPVEPHVLRALLAVLLVPDSVGQ